MGRTIKSPVEAFPGSVTFHDPLTYPQVIAYQEALDDAREIRETATAAKLYYILLPAVFDCVEHWDIANLPKDITPQTMPATPRKPTAEFAAWLIECVAQLFEEAEAVPNA